MKKQINIILLLVMISLSGIVMFQVYWCLNAYHVNKKNFDSKIDLAMQRAMDDCKKDYFDSIRVVLVRRLSDTSVKIKIDTLHEADTVHKQLSIFLKTHYTGLSSPFQTTNLVYNYYAKRLGAHPTVPQVLTEMSFYQPSLMAQFNVLFGMTDIAQHYSQLRDFLKAHSNQPSDSVLAHNQIITSGVYELPKNFRQADSIKLHGYFDQELHKMQIYSPFTLLFSLKQDTSRLLNNYRSETNNYLYAYHGFVFLQFTNQEPQFYTKAVFQKPQYAIIKRMTMVLVLSLLLIISASAGFNYLVKTIQKQRKLAELKDDFINNMTHELKTPIATLTVAIEGLQKFNALNDPEKTQRYLQTSRNELLRLNELVNKVLSVATFESKEVKLVKEKIDIDALIRSVIESEKLKTNKQVVITFVNEDKLASLEADPLHLRNVIINLVDNAIKYSDEPVKVYLQLKREGEMAVFIVKDNGRGIPAAHLKQVFEKFHRVPAGNVHDVKGTGLGLSYVKYIVEAHGGHVHVKSEIGQGSEFSLSIPI